MSTELKKVALRLEQQPDIRLAVGFGSVAAGTARPDSDIDIDWHIVHAIATRHLTDVAPAQWLPKGRRTSAVGCVALA